VRTAIGIALVMALLVVAGALSWIGAEWHYDNCVSDANGRYPIVVERRKGTPADVNERRRQRALDRCSRWPL
jgi:hypothetical protein